MVDLVLQKVEGWTLIADDVPRVRDVDLGERLGFERPRKIRELIERYRSAGILSDSDICPTVGRTSDPLGRGRPATEFWLSEFAAVFITVKSETAVANEIAREVVRVFIEHRRAQLAPPALPFSTGLHERLLVELLRAIGLLAEARGGRAISTGEILDRAYLEEDGHLKRLLVQLCPGHVRGILPTSTKLTRWLNTIEGQEHGGMRLARAEQKGPRRWRVLVKST